MLKGRRHWLAAGPVIAVAVGVICLHHPGPAAIGHTVGDSTPAGTEASASLFPPAALPARVQAAPDGGALDQLLIHRWSGTLYASAHPCVKGGSTAAPYLALTFDDGPKPWGTPLILDQLEKYHAHATFFLVGKQCVRFPAIVGRIAADGDEIGNHTYDHYRLPTIPLNRVADELERDRTLIRELTGQTMFLFRPPGGRINAPIQTVADSLGYTTVFWKLDSGELAKDMDPDSVYHRVVDNVQNGDVVLLHNGDRNIVLALPHIMQTLSARGFQFVTVSELMQLDGAAGASAAGTSPNTAPTPDQASPPDASAGAASPDLAKGEVE